MRSLRTRRTILMVAEDVLLARIDAIYRERSWVGEIFADLERVHADYIQTCDELMSLLTANAADAEISRYLRRREPSLQLTRKKLLAFARAYIRDFDSGVVRDDPIHHFARACYSYFDVIAGGQPSGGVDRQTSYTALSHGLRDLAAGRVDRTQALALVERCRQQLLRRSEEVVAAYAACIRTQKVVAGATRYGAVELRDEIDFVIVAMRDDEFRAVLRRFPSTGSPIIGRRNYNVSVVVTDSLSYRIVTTRTLSQGNIEATNIVHDVLTDFAPRCILFVGIAGGRPDDDFTLGDVVVSTRVQDYTVHSLEYSDETTYQVMGGPIDKHLATFIVNLPAREDELVSWSSPEALSVRRPAVSLTKELSIKGSDDWKVRVRESIARHFSGEPRDPVFVSGPITVTDAVIKDPEVLAKLLESSRSALAVDMESAGAYRVASENGVPFVAIRGISDIVGLKREPGWTAFACEAAAAFTHAFLRLRPLVPR